MDLISNLNEKELAGALRLQRTSLECPSCGAPFGDVSMLVSIECPYCHEMFKVTSLEEESRDDLSYMKLKVLAGIQMVNVTMSSRMDIQYDPKRYVDRSQANDAFRRFLDGHSLKQKLFLLLGEAGFGKTWLIAHWANQLRQEGYLVFYVRLSEGIDTFFRLVFEQTRSESLNKIKSVMDASTSQLPLVWIMDGYDEIHDVDDRLLLLTEFLRILDKSPYQLMVLSSRAYDWEHCRTRQDQDTLIQTIAWKDDPSAQDSFRLVRYSDDECVAAIRSYQLPPLERWEPRLAGLSFFPLWIRIISEFYAKDNKLPAISNRKLFDAYFTRMQLTNDHLKTMGDYAVKCLDASDFSKSLSIVQLTTWDAQMLNALNSSGVLLYIMDLWAPAIRFSTAAFAWIGIAYMAFIMQSSGQLDKLEILLNKIQHVSKTDRQVIIALIESFGITEDLLAQLKSTDNAKETNAIFAREEGKIKENVSYDALARQFDESEKQRKGIEAVVEKTSKDLSFYQEKFFDQKNRIKELDMQVEEMQSLIDQKTEIIKDQELAKEAFGTTKEALEAEKEELEKKLSEAKENVLKMTTENSKIKENLELREKEIEKLKHRLADVQKEASPGWKPEDENKELKSKLKEMRRRLGKYEKVDS